MKILFAGPSLAQDISLLVAGKDTFVCAGPVTRGGVLKAVIDGAVAIGIVDGRFEDTLSVWHKEILYALSLGVAVAGAASMGALRASECSAFGMIGIGEVYRRYATGQLTDDADVGQVHAPAELNYFALTEPLVNIEPTLAKMQAAELIDSAEEEDLWIRARVLHYKERTYRALFNGSSRIDSPRAEVLLAWTTKNAVNQKRLDALELVAWLKLQPTQRGKRPDWEFSDTSHWQALMRSLTECRAYRAA